MDWYARCEASAVDATCSAEGSAEDSAEDSCRTSSEVDADECTVVTAVIPHGGCRCIGNRHIGNRH